MRKIREALRLQASGLSNRKIAASIGVGPTVAGEYIRRARRADLSWPLPDDLSDEALEQRLFPAPRTTLWWSERRLPVCGRWRRCGLRGSVVR